MVGDLPWLSYHVSTDGDRAQRGAHSIRAGAGAVKLEGGRKRLDAVQAILDAEIPVMGHIGLTPQSIHALGGFKVQGKELDAAKVLADDAVALAEAGCFAIVLECVPDGVARIITEIGAGADDRDRRGPALRRSGARVARPARLFRAGSRTAKFVREYAQLESDATDGDRPVLRRRARGHVPVERRDVPHDRPHGRGARPRRR